MTYFTLIRHGQTDWNKLTLIQGHIDNPLNDTGKNQAKIAANKIKKLDKYDIIISSPLKRAYETAMIIQNELDYHLDIISMDDLIERDFGELEGGLVCDENYKKIFDESAEGLETLEELQSRGINALKNISKQYPNKRVLITTHSHLIKGVISAVDPTFDFTYTLENSSLNNFIADLNDEIKIRLIEYNK